MGQGGPIFSLFFFVFLLFCFTDGIALAGLVGAYVTPIMVVRDNF